MDKSQITNYKSQTRPKLRLGTPNTKIQNSKSFLGFGICILFIVCNLVLGNWNLSFAEDKIVAIVDNDVITQKDLDDFINFTRIQLRQQYSGQQLESKIQSMKLDLIQRLIEDRLILQEAKRLGIIVDESRIIAKIDEIRSSYRSDIVYQNALRQQGLVQADLEKRIREQFLMFNVIEYKIRSKITVNPSEVTDFFNSNRQELQIPQQRELEVINIGEEGDKAREIYNSLKKGVRLEDIAQRYALLIDKMNALQRGQFRKEIEDVIYGLEPEGFSPPVKIDRAYYIFKLLKIIPPREQNLTEAQDRIYTYLFNKKMEEEMNRWLEELKKNSYIKIFHE